MLLWKRLFLLLLSIITVIIGFYLLLRMSREIDSTPLENYLDFLDEEEKKKNKSYFREIKYKKNGKIKIIKIPIKKRR